MGRPMKGMVLSVAPVLLLAACWDSFHTSGATFSVASPRTPTISGPRSVAHTVSLAGTGAVPESSQSAGRGHLIGVATAAIGLAAIAAMQVRKGGASARARFVAVQRCAVKE